LHEVLAEIAIARDDAPEAIAHGRELEAIAARTASSRHRALADYVFGRSALLEGEPDRARELLQSALAVYAELGLERGTTDVLDGLALVAANTGHLERCARLAAAAAAARAQLRCAPCRSTVSRLDALREQLDQAGRVLWDAAWTEGSPLSLAEAIAYARRARGPRDRPNDGWGSLTPAESDVAGLAAVGMSNPEIASKLFMSRSTVKMHLSRVYFKLGLANRTELARTIATRSSDAAAAPGSDAVYRRRH
jgi:DNA-binding CsgD family transcriptional regulator